MGGFWDDHASSALAPEEALLKGTCQAIYRSGV